MKKIYLFKTLEKGIDNYYLAIDPFNFDIYKIFKFKNNIQVVLDTYIFKDQLLVYKTIKYKNSKIFDKILAEKVIKKIVLDYEEKYLHLINNSFFIKPSVHFLDKLPSIGLKKRDKILESLKHGNFKSFEEINNLCTVKIEKILVERIKLELEGKENKILLNVLYEL